MIVADKFDWAVESLTVLFKDSNIVGLEAQIADGQGFGMGEIDARFDGKEVYMGPFDGITVYFEGSGNPAEEHDIVGINAGDNLIGNYDKVENA